MIPKRDYPLKVGAAYYAVLQRDSDGYVRKATTGTWEARGTSAKNTYDIALTPNPDSSGAHHTFQFPSDAVGLDVYRWVVYERVGASGSEDYDVDVPVWSDEWNPALDPYQGVVGASTSATQVQLPAEFDDGSAVGQTIFILGFPGRVLAAMPSAGVYTFNSPLGSAPANGTRFSLGPMVGGSSDSPGVTTLLSRLTDPRATKLDFLDAAVTSRMASGASVTVSGTVTVGAYASGQSPADLVLATPATKIKTVSGGYVEPNLAMAVPVTAQDGKTSLTLGDCLQGSWAAAYAAMDNTVATSLVVKQPGVNTAWRTFTVTVTSGSPTGYPTARA